MRLSRPVYGTLRSSWTGVLGDLARDTLLAAALTSGVIRDPLLELRLTALRRALLERPLPQQLWDLQARLAYQGFVNEYAWAVSPEEKARLASLVDGPPTVENLLKFAAYRPLAEFGNSNLFAAADAPPALRMLIQQQIEEPSEERRLAAAMPSLTAIRDGVSATVREMYEANPYPRWTVMGPPLPQPIARIMRNQFPMAVIDPIPNESAPEILIAGGGTGQHPILCAGMYEGARVLAVDLSIASLAYAKRKTADMGLTNIDYAHADILEIEGRSFDVIEAVGSLQCMEDPEAAATKLISLLRPGGLLKLGLYSKTARLDLEPARELGTTYPSTTEGIRDFRAAIYGAPAESPLRKALEHSDFYSISTCRDLLLHVKEHLHDLTDIKRIIESNGLRMLGFVLPTEVKAAYRRRFPGDAAATYLDYWLEFEREDGAAFRLMYQLWAQKPT